MKVNRIKSTVLLILYFSYIIFLVKYLFFQDNEESSYNININRIQQKLTDNLKENKEIIKGLNKKELGKINNIEIKNYLVMLPEEKITFFNENNLNDEKVVFRPLKSTPYIIKYYITTYSIDRKFFLIAIILILFPLILTLIITSYISIYFIKPLEKTKTLVLNLIKYDNPKIKITKKDVYFSDVLWGIDILKKELKKEQNKVIELEKSKYSLIAGLSHEIKNPLASIKNYTLLLKENIYSTKCQKEKALDVILNKTRIIEKLTFNSTKYKSSFSYEDFENKEIYFSKIYNMLDTSFKNRTKSLKINYSIKKFDNDHLVWGNLSFISQVFENILENAIKYGDLKNLTVDYYIEDYYQIISIENTGSKVPENEIKYIFSEYYRGSNTSDQPGHGLGLSICKKIMQHMEGSIYSENTRSGFKIFLIFKIVS